MLVAEAQLLLAQDHAGRVDAADGAQFQLRASLPGMPIDEHRPFSGEGDLLAGGDVGRATDDRLRPLAGVDGSEAEAVGVGMGLDAEHVGHADELGLPLLADDLPALDLGDGIGHAACELLGGEVDIDVVAQPGEWKFHDGLLALGSWLLGVGRRDSLKCWMNRWSMRFTEVSWSVSWEWGPGAR